MNNVITSFFDNVKEKTTNPFFGTLIFVWLIRNWDLVYTLFNFDADCNLQDKKNFISTYYLGKSILWETSTNIGLALLLLIIGYSLLIVSRLIVNVTNHNIIPRMNEKTVSKLVVNKSRFDSVKKVRDEYFYRIQDLEEVNVGWEQKNTLLKEQYGNQSIKIKDLEDKLTTSLHSVRELENKFNDTNFELTKAENLLKDVNREQHLFSIKKLIDNIVYNAKVNLLNISGIHFETLDFYLTLVAKEKLTEFKYFSKEILKNKLVNFRDSPNYNISLIDNLIDMKLFEEINDGEYTYVHLTTLGLSIIDNMDLLESVALQIRVESENLNANSNSIGSN